MRMAGSGRLIQGGRRAGDAQAVEGAVDCRVPDLRLTPPRLRVNFAWRRMRARRLLAQDIIDQAAVFWEALRWRPRHIEDLALGEGGLNPRELRRAARSYVRSDAAKSLTPWGSLGEVFLVSSDSRTGRACTSPSLRTRPFSTFARPRNHQPCASLLYGRHPSRHNHNRRDARSPRATSPCRFRPSTDQPAQPRLKS